MPTLREIRDVQIMDSLQREMKESVNVQRYWAMDDTTDEPTENLRRYRQISPFGQGTSPSSLPQIVQLKMQEVGLWLYQANPIAHRYIEQTKDFVLGDGVRVEAKDHRIDEYLHAFWNHPFNKMDRRLSNLIVELGIYGEILQGLTFMPNDILRMSYISPKWIVQVAQDPEDISHFKSVTLSMSSSGVPGIVTGNPDLELLSLGDNGYLRGDAVFVAINRAADATRGISDLLPLMDVLGNLDTFMFNVIERARSNAEWFWDITYEGANREQLMEYARQLDTEGTYPGARRLHNEKVKWGIQSTDTKKSDSDGTYESLFSLIVTGLGIPPHWTGVGGGAIRAGAESAQEPSYKRLISRQSEVRSFLEDICNYQIDRLILAGHLPRRVNREFTLHFPKIAIRDAQRLGGATNRIVSAVLDAMEKGVYTKEEAKARVDAAFKSLEQVS